MRFICRGVGILVLAGVAAVSGYGQDDTKSQDKKDQQATSQTYIFPSGKERFQRYVKDTIGPFRLLRTGAAAGIAQWRDAPEEWGQGMKGYARRYGSAITDQAVGNFMTEAIYPTLFREDPRYFRKTTGPIKKRAFYALSRVLITRTDAGSWRPNAAEILGNGTVAAIGNLYYPDGRRFDDNMQRMFSQIGTDAISNVLKEFWPDLKRRFAHS